MAIDGKEIPAPIVLAHEALAALTQEDAALAESLKSVLPAYALRQEKAGVVLTPESLLAAARKGAVWLRAQDTQPAPRDTRTPLEIYQDIIGKFPAPPPNFWDLCAAGDLERVKALHENAFDDADDIHTAAIWAAINGHLHVLQYLHENGADILAQNHRALIGAARKGDLPTVEYLVENGADISAQNHLALVEAASNGALNTVRYLVENGADISARNHRALVEAVDNRDLNTVRYLVENGADISAQNHQALFRAVDNRDLNTVRYLVENGADISAQDHWALIGAASQGDLNIVRYLVENGADISAQDHWALIGAAGNGALNTVRYLVKNGADISAQGHWALIGAARKGDLPTVEYLVKNGANISAQNHRALVKAASNGALNTVRYLVENGADISAQDHQALVEAAGNGDLNTVRYLVENGADISARNHRALFEAASNGDLNIVRYLVKNGADISAQNHRALIGAARKGDLPTVEYLVENGADISAQNHLALFEAASKGDLNTVRYLVEKGADISAQNHLALLGAAGEGALPIVHYILDKYPDRLSSLTAPQQRRYQAYSTALSQWRKILRRDPLPGLDNRDPRYFKSAAYEFILPLLAEEKYENNVAARMAFSAAALFQSPARVMQYLEAWGQQGKQPLHDVVHMIALPETRGAMNVKDWGDAVLKLGPNMAELVKFADRVPSPMRSADGKSWSYQATRALCAQFSYERGAEHPALAALCFENDVDEDTFNKALKIVLKGSPTVKNLPDISIDGERFGMPGAKFYRLLADDIRGLFLGELTDCCQSIGGDGDKCAQYGYQSKNGGFYVVENAMGRVVSQTFAWRARGGGLCFDTLETLGQNVTAAQWVKILQEVAAELTLRQDHDLTQLSVGLGGGTPEKKLKAVFNKSAPATPLDYTGYSEAQKQVMIWQRNTPANHL